MRTLRLLLTLWLAASGLWAQRRISIIVDTSGSMNKNDPERYAVQISKILTDLVNDGDLVQVVRMPSRDEAARKLFGVPVGEECAAGPNPALAVELRGSNRRAFKTAIDGLLVNRDGTFFVQAFKTAVDFLGTSPGVQRMLLFVADSGGFETNCAAQMNSDLDRFHRTGVYTSLINLGSTIGAFSGNPGFDNTAAAPNAEALVRAVAQNYQRFLGGKKVQTGAASSRVSVTIDPYVKEAFIVIAGEGPVRGLDVLAGNPGAANIEEDYRGGGDTVDLRGYSRGYRIVRLVNPNAGTWTISAPGVSDGGWMLIQDYSIGIRALPAQPVSPGATAQIQFEAYDQRTGQRITDAATLRGMKVDVSMAGTPISATNNGDGTFSATHKFTKVGKHTVQARVSSGVIDRSAPVVVEVSDGGWRTMPQTPARVEADTPLALQVKMEPTGPGMEPPQKVIAEVEGRSVELTPMGGNIYSGPWTPTRPGKVEIQFKPVGGFNATGGTAMIEVMPRKVAPPPAAPSATSTTPTPAPAPPSPASPTTAPKAAPPASASPTAAAPPPPPPPPPPDFRMGRPRTVKMAGAKSGATASAQVVFDDAKIPQETTLQVVTSLERKGATLEIQSPEGWQALGASPVTLKAAAGQAANWPVRLKVEACPQACSLEEKQEIVFITGRPGGGEDRTVVPLQVEIVPDPWLTCNWRWLAALAGLLLTGIITYGFIWPERFGARVGLQMSPEIDLSEGFFYHLRAQPGSKISFYRHARVFVHRSFQITGKPSGALVKLRAGRKKTYIQPMPGQTIWRQRMDGEWERIAAEETVARENTIYRNDDETLFFDLRLR